METLLVHKKSAGMTELSKSHLLEALRAAGLRPTYSSSKSKKFRKYLDRPWDLIVAAGGDGTVGKVLMSLPDRSIPVGVLPLGGANNIAHSLGIGGPLEEIMADWQPVRAEPFDVGVARGAWGLRRFVEAAGFGALAEALFSVSHIRPRSREEKQQIGRDALRKSLKRAEPAPYALTLDGRTISGDFLLVEVMNVSTIGPRLTLAPQADPGDGWLHVVMAEARRRDELLAWLDDPESGAAPVTVRRAQSVEVLTEPAILRLDAPREPQSTRGKPVRFALECEQTRILGVRRPVAINGQGRHGLSAE
jgi:diacylglycerol kinase family enzyme